MNVQSNEASIYSLKDGYSLKQKLNTNENRVKFVTRKNTSIAISKQREASRPAE